MRRASLRTAARPEVPTNTRAPDAAPGSGAEDVATETPTPARRLAAPGPSRDTRSAALLATIAQRVEGDGRALDLAAEFLAAAAPGPWALQFMAWADERHLAPELGREVQRVILRKRCGNFGGPEPRPHGRKARRRR